MGEAPIEHQDKQLVLDKRDMGPKALERSTVFIDDLVTRLEVNSDFSNLREISIDYTQPFAASIQEYPQQIAAIISVFQPDIGTTSQGFLDPGSYVITTKRADQAEWGAGIWTTPMGKIELKDSKPDDALGDVILKAADRESGEEIERESTGGFSFIASSFFDESTGNLIHVAVNEIGDDAQRLDKVSEVALPDLREHSDIRWTKLREVPSLEPINAGSKFVFLTALKFIKQQNAASLESGRYI